MGSAAATDRFHRHVRQVEQACRIRTASSGPAGFASGVNQWTRCLQILVLDCVRRPVRKRSYRAGRILAGVLREYAGAGDEHVRNVPDLKILVQNAGVRIRTRTQRLPCCACFDKARSNRAPEACSGRSCLAPISLAMFTQMSAWPFICLISFSWKSNVIRNSGRPKTSV